MKSEHGEFTKAELINRAKEVNDGKRTKTNFINATNNRSHATLGDLYGQLFFWSRMSLQAAHSQDCGFPASHFCEQITSLPFNCRD